MLRNFPITMCIDDDDHHRTFSTTRARVRESICWTHAVPALKTSLPRAKASTPKFDVASSWFRPVRARCYRNCVSFGRRSRTSERYSLITVSSATGVNGLRRQREAPSSSAMLRKSGAGALRLAKA
jgi:hypothetical protein